MCHPKCTLKSNPARSTALTQPFTVSEMMEVLESHGYNATIVSPPATETEASIVVNFSKPDDLDFAVYLDSSGPFYESFDVYTLLPTSQNPYPVANLWNEMNNMTKALAKVNFASGTPLFEDESFWIEQRIHVPANEASLSSIFDGLLPVWEFEVDQMIDFLHQLEDPDSHD